MKQAGQWLFFISYESCVKQIIFMKAIRISHIFTFITPLMLKRKCKMIKKVFVWICVNIYFGDKWHNRVTQYLSKWLWGYNNIDSLLLQMINTTLSYARQAALCTDHSSTFTRSHLWLETLIFSVIFHSVIFYYYLLYRVFRPVFVHFMRVYA